MDFAPSPTATKLRDELLGFMEEHVYPAEAVHRGQLAELGDPHGHPPVLEDLKAEARRRGLWNLFFPGRLSNVDYAPLAEIMGRSLLAAEACNCSAPDTGNMELLSLFGSDDQKQRWLDPLLDGAIRSAFAMTEPAVASSDATNISCRIERSGGDYVINGRKWWISGAASSRCAVFIVMGKTEPAASPYRQQSMVLVPRGTEGVTVVRNLPVFGYADREGHCEVVFEDVRVPVGDILGEEGGGFAMAQARLGPGRIHHCMRTIGAAERALELLCRRVLERHAFGKALAEQGVIQEWIADARIEIDQARLYTLHAAWLMDTQGNKSARTAVSGIKVAVPLMALRVIDHAIQAHGAAGIGDDFPLAWMYAHIRTLRLADGPDEVHRGVVARHELRRWT
jgi:acyl-CoA dehydrogenase